MFKAAIFDLDGTLADTVDSMAYCGNRALKELGLPEQPYEEYKHFAGDGVDELIRRALAAAGDTKFVHFDEMGKIYREYFSRDCMYHVLPYDGIIDMLEVLKEKGIKTAVLSNKPDAQAVDVIETLFGKGYFDHIQGQREGIPRKPSPEGALAIADKFRVRPGECLYLGDTDTDMKTGNAAGMYTVGVLWGFRTREELEKNHAMSIVEKPWEILELVKRQND